MKFVILLLVVLCCHLSSSNTNANDSNSANSGYNDVNNLEIQAINSYLTDQLKGNYQRGDVSVATKEIDQAIRLIEDQPDINKFPSQLRENSHKILSILKDISRGAKSCQDNEDLSFVSIIADSQTFLLIMILTIQSTTSIDHINRRTSSEGQILNQYATDIILQCWNSYIDFFAKKLDTSLGKLKSPIVESLSSLYYRFNDAKQTDGTGQIKIREQRVGSPSLDELVRVFANFNIVNGDEIPLSKAIDRLAQNEAREGADNKKNYSFDSGKYFKTNYLEPCKLFLEELSRFRAEFNYKKYTNTTLGRALHAKAAGNKELAYELQVCRICRYLVNAGKKILSRLR